ncbi:MAG TPA: 4Fe-4S dicluster domain-containing protein [Ktedonobacterales bacterium]|jgi:Na+-translocating ferredoxin:NAD+ oxidoreductase RnfC subunit
MPRPASQVADELAACIRCNLCLAACPALEAPITIEALNRQTLDGPISSQVMRFAQSCYQCGACVPVCPVGLHRDSMMMWLKIRLICANSTSEAQDASEDFYGDTCEEEDYIEAEDWEGDSPQTWAARGWYDEEPY